MKARFLNHQQYHFLGMPTPILLGNATPGKKEEGFVLFSRKKDNSNENLILGKFFFLLIMGEMDVQCLPTR